MSKHTPGPWAALPEEVHRNYIRIRGTVLGCRYKIANVITPDYDDGKEREAKETRANARLIAAAPELLEAAVDLVSRDFGSEGWDEACEQAALKLRAAIAKATGEPQ